MQGVTKLTVARDNVFHDSYSAVMAFPVRSNGICEGLKVRLSLCFAVAMTTKPAFFSHISADCTLHFWANRALTTVA